MSELESVVTSTNAAELLRSLRRLGVQVGLSGGRIQVSAPAGVLGSDLQAAIRELRGELIVLLEKEREQRETAVAEVIRHDAPVRLSPGQSRLWLFQQLDPTSPAYNLTPTVRIEGPLDVARLERAFAAVLERHEPLRSVVDTSDPVGLIRPLPVPSSLISFVDLAHLSGEEQRLAVVARVQQDQRDPFDLTAQIPIRATLLRLGADLHQLVTTIHHIAVDGVSLQHFYRDLATFYDGRTPERLRATYREYSAWEQSYWNADRLAQRTEFWRRTMQGVPPVLDLPTDVARGASPSFDGAIVSHVLQGAEHDAVRELMRSEGASLFMVLVGALGAALHRHSGQRDMVIGTPLHGRDRPEYSDLVGMFVNQLPLRVRVPRGATLRELVRAARATALATLTEHELPFGSIVDAVGVPRDSSRNPLFQVLLNVLPPTSVEGGLPAGGVKFVLPDTREMLALFDGQSRFDVTLYVTQRAGEIHLSLVYNRDLFRAERAEALVGTLGAVLAAAAQPDASLDSLLRPAALSAVEVPHDPAAARNETVLDRIRAVAARTPDAGAIADDDGVATYAELMEVVDRVARLVATAAGASTGPVGVMVTHDRQIPIGILGVLASGRPYVPLDPEYPVERLRLMAEDSRMDFLLVSPSLRERAEALLPGRVLSIDAPGTDTAVVTPPQADDVAYLLYTSGSTGTPKAVMQSHRNLLVQAERYAAVLELTPGDRVALLASISFDASLMDLFGGLIRGACVRAIDPHTLDLSLLPEIVCRDGISTLHLTPTVFRALGRNTKGAAWTGVRAVVLGGESVRADDVAQFDAAFPAGARLLNLYGASEHSFSIGQFLPRDHRSLEVPAGRPLGDVEVLLLDPDGQEDPVTGEMVIRSAHNVLGYHGQPERTAASFRNDESHPGRTLYRTGDLARRLPDGRYVVLGRVDGQVKVRGHRVELSEIETILRRHAAIQEVGVHAPRVGSDGEHSLVACYVLQPGASADGADLASWCSRWLPRYMVPGGWVAVERLPRTPSGKVDRRALPVPAAPGGKGNRLLHIHQGDAEEELLQEIWHGVLRTDGFGPLDDFFLVGGNSLTATQVVARIRDVMGVQIPLRQFFDHPTIEDTARWIREHRAGSVPPPPLEPRRPLPEPLPLAYSQERMWLLKQLAPDTAAYNMFAAVRLRGPLDVARLRGAIEQVVQRQISLRTVFPAVHGRPVQRILPGGYAFSSEIIDALAPEEALAEASRRAEAIMEATYHLETGPLFRVYIARLGDDDHLFAVGMHHIISDMWSFSILGRELAACYGGQADALPSLEVGYPDYSIWQREWLGAGTMSDQLEHWRERLTGIQPLDLASDHVRPPFFSYEGATIYRDIPEGLRDAIEAMSAQNRATPFMTTLAAFNVLLAAHSGQSDVAVGVPIANRTQSATEHLIGTFVNTLVHRNHVEPEITFRDLLERVRSTALDAFAHQDIPFELLVKELQPARDPSRPPLVQVLFNVANIGTQGVELPGLHQELVPLDRGTAQFELVANVAMNAHQSHVQLTFNTGLFDPVTAERLLGHYVEMLERVVQNPHITVAELQRVSSMERSLLLEGWNQTAKPYPLDTNLPALLQETASRWPHEVAVQSPSGSFTYAELVEHARRVTAALRTMGVRPGDRVAIVMQRSREMLSALIGILGTGAAYVPVDPNYPAARVTYMLEDAGVAAVVTHGGLEQPYAPTAPVLDLDRWTPPPPADFAVTQPGDAAYVIYTSGSTGKPKGVEVPHGAMVNFLLSMQEEPGFSAGDRLLAVTTISFDIAVLELYLPLVAGGRVVIASEDEVLDGRRLLRRIEEEGITLMQATPATWKLMLAAGWEGSPGLRVLCGGEPLPPKLSSDLLDRVSELWNMYGPTETTVWSTLERIERDAPILVGRPIANTTLYVLDDALQPRPIGVPGELYIGGAGVANGYVNRPDLTSERFLPDPFRPGERIYRTGDLVRYRHDGRLEHLGRLDNQVKVRGFRIELGEVEAALQAHPTVHDAVVTAADDRLVGYVVFNPGAAATSTELRSWVTATLPPYMVPGFIVPLEELPLTPNGKVDRKQLPAPVSTEPEPVELDEELEPMERVIAEVWSSLLGIDRISAGDNFFEIGGHSLLAVEAVALIEERTGHRPEPRSLFFMTLSELASTIPAPASSAMA